MLAANEIRKARPVIEFRIWMTIPIVAFAILSSYGFAQLGHPTAVWMWRDMLGLM